MNMVNFGHGDMVLKEQLGIGSEPRDESPLGGNEYYNQHKYHGHPLNFL